MSISFCRLLKSLLIISNFLIVPFGCRLVDGLQDKGYKMHLANPSAIQQYEGQKHTDAKWDSFWLAHMLKLGILPQGYIYPKKLRPMRDLMRRRLRYVNQRTSHVLSLQSMLNGHLAMQLNSNEIKKLKLTDADKLFKDPLSISSVKHSIGGFPQRR
jgi:transposase